MVPISYHQIRTNRVLRYFRLLHPQTLGLLHLGENPEVLRWTYPSQRCRERLLPDVRIKEGFEHWSRTHWRIRTRSCLGHQIWHIRACRAHRHQTNQLDHHVSFIRQVDPISQRPSPQTQPMDQCCQMGVQESNSIHQNQRVPLAGRSYCLCYSKRSWRRDSYLSRFLQKSLRGVACSSSLQGQEDRKWEICRRRFHYNSRDLDFREWKSYSGCHKPPFGAELC